MGSGQKTGEQSSSGSWGSVQYAPHQIGAKSPITDALGSKNYKEMVNGIYDYIKAYAMQAADAVGAREAAARVKGTNEGLQSYEDQISLISDKLVQGLATGLAPDELKNFELDSFIPSSIKEIYSKAESIFNNPVSSQNEIKVMIDRNIGNLAGQFRQRRRALEQEIAASGKTGPAAVAALDRMENDIARGKEATGREVFANEIGQKYNRQMAALGTMGQATQTGAAYVSDQANRWLNQWGQKLNAEKLRQAGLTTAMQGYQGAAGIEQQQFGNAWQQMNYPLSIVTGAAMPFFSEVGRQDISSYSGAGNSWGSQQSSGTQWGSNPWTSIGSAAIGGAMAGAGFGLGGAAVGALGGAASGAAKYPMFSA